MTAVRSPLLAVDPGLFDHPKVHEAARDLALSSTDMGAALIRLWNYCKNKSEDGVLCELPPKGDPQRKAMYDQLAAIALYPNGTRFVNTLVRRKLIDQDPVNQRLLVHDWRDWQVLDRPMTHTTNGHAQLALVESPPEPVKKGRKKKAVDPEHEGNDEYGVPRAPFPRFMWWLVTGFGFRGYQKTGFDLGFMKKETDTDMALVAECYIAIAEGIWGEPYDRRNLNAAHAVKKANAFAAMKERRRVTGYLIPITAEGAAVVSAGGTGSSLAGTPPEDIVARSGRPHKTSDGYDPSDLESHPKLRAYRNRTTKPEDDDGF